MPKCNYSFRSLVYCSLLICLLPSISLHLILLTTLFFLTLLFAKREHWLCMERILKLNFYIGGSVEESYSKEKLAVGTNRKTEGGGTCKQSTFDNYPTVFLTLSFPYFLLAVIQQTKPNVLSVPSLSESKRFSIYASSLPSHS